MTGESIFDSKTVFLSGAFRRRQDDWLQSSAYCGSYARSGCGDEILVLVPQRTLGQPYKEALHRP